jgi:hypothetical protein
MGAKLEEIIKEIGKKQIARFEEKSSEHSQGTKYDVLSDLYDWNIDDIGYWMYESMSKMGKVISLLTPEINGKESTAIIDLINVLTALYHKIELTTQEVKQ